MENRLKMYFSEQAKEIMEMLFEFQNEGHGTVFFDISGHVQCLSVRVFVPVWVEDAEPTYKDSVYVDNDENTEYVERLKLNLSNYLNRVKSLQTA